VGRVNKRSKLEPRTDFLAFKKSPKAECGLDSRICSICNNLATYFSVVGDYPSIYIHYSEVSVKYTLILIDQEQTRLAFDSEDRGIIYLQNVVHPPDYTTLLHGRPYTSLSTTIRTPYPV
jgi:hypothetical protein